MTALPPISDLTASTVNQGAAKTYFGALRGFLAGLLGEDGTVATALATLGALGGQYLALSAATTLTAADRGKVVACSGTFAVTLPAASAAGAGWSAIVANTGAGTISVARAGSDLIGGATTITVPPLSAALLSCTATGWIALGIGAMSAAGQSLAAAGSAAAPGLAGSGDPDSGLYWPAANSLGWVTGGTEWMRLTSAGALRLGNVGADITGLGAVRLALQGTSAATQDLAQMRASANAVPPIQAFVKSRGAAVGDYTIVQSGDYLGRLAFYGADGSTTVLGARIEAIVTGTPAAGDVRADLHFSPGSGAGGAVMRALALTGAGQALFANGSAALPSVAAYNDGNTGLYWLSSDILCWATGGVEALRVDATQQVGIGTAAPSTKLHVAGPIRCGSYTVGTVPSASAVGAGSLIQVSNESGGATLAMSDGTNWRRVHDRAVIS